MELCFFLPLGFRVVVTGAFYSVIVGSRGLWGGVFFGVRGKFLEVLEVWVFGVLRFWGFYGFFFFVFFFWELRVRVQFVGNLVGWKTSWLRVGCVLVMCWLCVGLAGWLDGWSARFL